MSADDPAVLDLDPIRARLAIAIEHKLLPTKTAHAEFLIDLHEQAKIMLVWFLTEVPTDIAALLAEVERLRAESIDTNDGDNPYETLPCGDCDVPYRDHVNEEGAAPCDNFRFCQDTAADLRADCSDLWEANARLRAEIETLRAEISDPDEELAQLGADFVKEWSDGL